MPDSDVKDPGCLLRDGELRRLRGQPEWDNTDYNRDHSWWGQPRTYKVGVDPAPGDDWVGLVPVVEGPTHEERVERCELMGMVFCNCRLKDGHVVVYNPACPVHNLLAKLSR